MKCSYQRLKLQLYKKLRWKKFMETKYEQNLNLSIQTLYTQEISQFLREADVLECYHSFQQILDL